MVCVRILRPGSGTLLEGYEVRPIDRITHDYRSLGLSMVNIRPHSPSKEMHRHDCDEELWLIASGEGVVTFDGGKETRVGSGDVVYCPRGGEHQIRNDGEEVLSVFNIHLAPGDS